MTFSYTSRALHCKQQNITYGIFHDVAVVVAVAVAAAVAVVGVVGVVDNVFVAAIVLAAIVVAACMMPSLASRDVCPRTSFSTMAAFALLKWFHDH